MKVSDRNSFWANQNYSDSFRYLYPSQSEKRFVTRLIKNGKKSIRPNPNKSEATIRMNPNQFETKFSTIINPSSDWSKPNFQSKLIWIIPIADSFVLILIENSVWINPSSDIFGLMWIENLFSDWFGFIPINLSEFIGLSPIDFSPFFIKRVTNVFRIGSEWFALARIQISEWIAIVLIVSELIPIRYFRINFYLNPNRILTAFMKIYTGKIITGVCHFFTRTTRKWYVCHFFPVVFYVVIDIGS